MSKFKLIRNEMDESDVELLRILLKNGAARYEIRALPTDEESDPGMLGIMLADLMKHLAGAFADVTDYPPEVVLARVLSVFLSEMKASTDETRGEWKIDPEARH